VFELIPPHFFLGVPCFHLRTCLLQVCRPVGFLFFATSSHRLPWLIHAGNSPIEHPILASSTFFPFQGSRSLSMHFLLDFLRCTPLFLFGLEEVLCLLCRRELLTRFYNGLDNRPGYLPLFPLFLGEGLVPYGLIYASSRSEGFHCP